MLRNLFVITVISAMLSACSTSTKGRVVEAEPAKLKHEVIEVENMEDAAAQMDILTDEAMKSSDSTRKFLSTDLYIKGNDASMRGDSATAAFLFKYVYKLNPNDIYLKKKYAIELIRVGQLEESKTLLEEAFIQEKFLKETTGLILGGIYTAVGSPKIAIKTYEKVVKHNPKSEEACIFLGKAYALEKKFKKAVKLLSKCERKMPKNGIFAYYKGKISLSRKSRKSALTHFRKSLKRDKTFYQSAIALGLLYEEREKFAKAKKVYRNFLESNPMSFAILSRMVQIKFATEDYQNIIDYAQRLSSLDSNDLNLKVKLGILYTDEKRFDDAKGIFKEVLVAMPDSDKVLYYLASLFVQTGDYENALSYFNKIEIESSLFHDSHIQMGQILSAMAHDNQEALPKFETFVLEQSEKHDFLKVELKVLMAAFYEEKKNYFKAISLVKGLRTHKSYNENHDYYLASLYEKIGKFVESRKVIEELITKNPNNAHALNFLGYSLLEQNIELDKAFIYIKKAVALKPDDGFIRDSLGWYYYKTGQLELALQEIKKARLAVKTDVVITKHLAIIYQELQRYEEAKKYYNEALKLCKVQSERDDVLKAMGELDVLRLPASKK